MLSDNYGVGQSLINAHRYKTAVLEQIICSGLESALASLLSNICFKAGDIKLTPVQHLKATIPVYKMSIKERRHRNTNPPFEWGWTDSSSFFGRGEQTGWSCRSAGSRWVAYNLQCLEKSRDIFAVSFSFSLFWTSMWIWFWSASPSFSWLRTSREAGHRLVSVTSHIQWMINQELHNCP